MTRIGGQRMTRMAEQLALFGNPGPGRMATGVYQKQRTCEVEALCHEGLPLNGGGAYPYICGFRMAGMVQGCPKRERLLSGREL